MGTVHVATVSGNGPGPTRVAVKILHRHLLARPGVVERFLREGELGRRIRHDNVVATLEVGSGELRGREAYYLATEFVEGRSLRQLLADLGTVPEALLREVASQVCDGLDAIHRVGIVHRDLKPENVLITEDRRVRIMDLGVALLMDESARLTHQGGFTGSLLYAAPEQLTGRDVGPAADLYALGVMLYELSTGENPFGRDEPSGVVNAQLNAVPVPVRQKVPELSPFFSHLVATLLEKELEDRFASAPEVGAILREGEHSAWWTHRARELRRRKRGRPRFPVPRTTGLVGREPEIEICRGAWREAREGRGCVLFLDGETGIGKTRLVAEFVDRIDGEEVRVLYGDYSPSLGIGGLSEGIIDHFGAAALDSALVPFLSTAARLVPSFAALLKHESPPGDDETISGDALHALFVRLMHGMAAKRPLVWVLDDLQFAGADSRRILLSLARAVPGHRVLLILVSRKGLPAAEVEAFEALPHTLRLRLGRLSPRRVIELLREAFRSGALADRLGARIAFKSDGVPFFILELIRGLEDGRLIERLPDGSYEETQVIDEIGVPLPIRGLVRERLRGLSDLDQGILEVAAVHGFDFDPDLVAGARGTRRMEVLERLAAIERRTGIVRGEGEGYRFDQHQIQEVLYADLHPALRAEYHTALAEALEARETTGRPLAGETARQLAVHHLSGVRPSAALPYLTPALSHLERSYRHEAMLDLAGRALRIEGLFEDSPRADLLLRVAAALRFLGRWEEECKRLREALHLVEDGDVLLPARIRRSLGFHHFNLAHYEEAEHDLRAALDLARAAGARREEGTAERGLGAVLWALHRPEEARDHRERALAIAREIGDEREEAKATGNLGNLHFYLDRYDEARKCYERELELALRVGDRREEGMAHGGIGLVLSKTGLLDEAVEHYRRGLEIAHEIGDRQGEAAATANLSGLLMKDGRLAEALDHRRRSLAVAREIGQRSFEGIALSGLGLIFLHLGEDERAREALEDGRALLTEIGAESSLADAVSGLGVVALRAGRLGEAAGLLEAAIERKEEVPHPHGAALTRILLGRTRAAQGRTGEARREFTLAHDLGRELGAPDLTLIAACALAGLLGDDPAAALEACAREEPRLSCLDRMEARYLLFAATGDPEHLEESRRLLEGLRDHAPAEFRDTLFDNVPLHREILMAGREA